MGTLAVLADVSITVAAGEFVSILGPSGCGKSTLLDIIAGLQQPEQGTIFLDGQNITGQLGKVGYMPQKDLLLPWQTLLANVTLPLTLQGVPRQVAQWQARELLPRFGLAGFEQYYPHQLSGGMRQRAALLRTYLFGQDLWLLDEPFGATDALTRRDLQHWLLKVLGQFQGAVLLVTHDIDEAIYLSQRIYLLSGRPGRVLAELVVPVPRGERLGSLNHPELIALKEQILERLGQGTK